MYIHIYMYLDPKVCKLMAFWAVLSGFRPLFYILWGSRQVPKCRACTRNHYDDSRGIENVDTSCLSTLDPEGYRI